MLKHGAVDPFFWYFKGAGAIPTLVPSGSCYCKVDLAKAYFGLLRILCGSVSTQSRALSMHLSCFSVLRGRTVSVAHDLLLWDALMPSHVKEVCKLCITGSHWVPPYCADPALGYPLLDRS